MQERTSNLNKSSELIKILTNKEKSEKELLEEISKKLDKLIGILAIQGKDKDEQIKILKKLKFTSEETGNLLGLTDTAVRMRKSWKGN